MFLSRASLASKASPGKLAYKDQRYWLQVQDDVWERVGPGRVLEKKAMGSEEVERLPPPPGASFSLLSKVWLERKVSQSTLRINGVALGWGEGRQLL